jgi:DNA-binding NarL/FixJ family response regulator
MTWEGAVAVLRGQKIDARPDLWTSASGRLSVPEREEILLGLHRGLSMRAIALAIGRAPSTITGEVKANGGARELSHLAGAPTSARLH